MRPVIGICSAFDYDKGFSYVKTGYYKAILKAGGLPLIIPATEEYEILNEYIEKVEGILLPGGPDLDARLFGESNYTYNGYICPVRDSMEIYMAKSASECNKPLLGICRGAQVINAAFGGNLYQDISSQFKNQQILKHSQEAPLWYPVHDIHIEEGSRTRSWFSANHAGVNSFHHQAIKDVAPGFIIAAKTEDGIIESIENCHKSFIVGVQWHPEVMWEQNPEFLTMFQDFVNCCKRGR